MKALVTGASGFVGAWIVHSLAMRGHHVVGVDRAPPSEQVRRLLSSGGALVHATQSNLIDRGGLTKLFEATTPDLVVHAAAQTSLEPESELADPYEMVETNVTGSINVFVAASRVGVRRALYISTAGVFAPGSVHDRPIGEESCPRPMRLYGITKYSSELLWRRFGELSGTQAVCVRLAQPYGPLEATTDSRRVLSPIQEWFEAGRLGLPLTVPAWPAGKDWIYVADVARAIVLLATAEHLSYDLYHVGAGRVWRVDEVVAVLREFYPALTVRRATDPRKVNPNVGPFGLKGVLSTRRLTKDTGYTPEYDLRAGLRAYRDWIEASTLPSTSGQVG